MNKIVVKNNKTCSIDLPENPELLFVLRTTLSYKAIGVEYTQAFKNGWDGITYLMDKKGNFPLGLLDKVKAILDEQSVKYEVEDKRKPIVLNAELDISAKLKEMGKEPRDYQSAVVEAALKNRKGIIRATTGAGKTLCAALITAKFNKPTIIYVIGLDLLGQFHKTLTEIFNEPIGYIGNGVCEIQRINVATIWTVGKSLDIKAKMFEEDEPEDEEDVNVLNKLKIQQLLKATELHIFDECHSVSCDTVKEIYKNIDPPLLYGMSGTPYRDDGTDLLINGMLGEQIINVSASELIERRILAQPIIKFINVPATPIYGRTYADVYAEYIVDNEARNFMIMKETKNLMEKGYQVLVLFKQIKHGKLLHKLFKENGIECEILHGAHKLEQRDEIKEQLMSKKLNVVLASVVFDIGIDIPTLSALVLAGSGKSSVKALQRIGRVIRGYPGKNYAAIVDFVDNARFLKNHSQARYKIYSSEKGFIVKYPKQEYMK
jgi:superfamily II DNA or RNA helicase